jgi:outer membrane protein
MKYITLHFLMIFSLFANTVPTESSSIDSVEKLTLKVALEHLDTNNLELKIAENSVKINKLKVKQVWGKHLGKLDVQVTANYLEYLGGPVSVDALKIIESTGAVSADSLELTLPDAIAYIQPTLTYQLPIYVGGKISIGTDMTMGMRDLAELGKSSLRFKKRYEIKKSFYDVEMLTTLLKKLQSVEQNLLKLKDITVNMIEEGYAKKIDLLEIQSKLASITRLITQSKAHKKLALDFISFTLDEKVTDIDTNSLKELEQSIVSVDIDDLLMVKKAGVGLELSKSAVDLAVAEYKPSLGAFAEVGTYVDPLTLESDTYSYATVGVQLNWNFFNGFSDLATVEEAKVKVMKSKTELALSKKGLKLKIESLQTEIASLEADLVSIQSEVDFSEKIVENYRNRYAEKLSAISDVMRVESTHIQKVLEYKKTTNAKNDKVLQLQMLTQGI